MEARFCASFVVGNGSHGYNDTGVRRFGRKEAMKSTGKLAHSLRAEHAIVSSALSDFSETINEAEAELKAMRSPMT